MVFFYSFVVDVGSNNSGYYELRAVLTHKGRSSSSGHYVAWVKGKKKGQPLFWLLINFIINLKGELIELYAVSDRFQTGTRQLSSSVVCSSLERCFHSSAFCPSVGLISRICATWSSVGRDPPPSFRSMDVFRRFYGFKPPRNKLQNTKTFNFSKLTSYSDHVQWKPEIGNLRNCFLAALLFRSMRALIVQLVFFLCLVHWKSRLSKYIQVTICMLTYIHTHSYVYAHVHAYQFMDWCIFASSIFTCNHNYVTTVKVVACVCIHA